jgi:hypothetical protein
MLPESEIAFLDEIFKSNSAILNSLLTLLNEGRFFTGNRSIKGPLCSLYGPINEIPNDDALSAIFDRFLIRFHDTRHTTASLLIMFGANPAAVQRILRHSDIRVTMDLYTHLAPNYLRDEINRLSFRPKPELEQPAPEAARAVANSARSDCELHGFTSPVLPPGLDTPLAGSGHPQKALATSAVAFVGVAGFEPTTSCSQSRRATSCATPRLSCERGRTLARSLAARRSAGAEGGGQGLEGLGAV